MAHAGVGGLQSHSIGELYPWTIAGRGRNPVKWQAQNLLTGEKGPRRLTYEMAEYDVRLRTSTGSFCS